MSRRSRVVREVPAARTLYLGAHTLGRMRPQQIAGIGLRNAREQLLPRLPIDFDRRYDRRVPSDPVASTDAIADNTAVLRDSLDDDDRRRRRDRACAVADGRVVLMNQTVRLERGEPIDWQDDRFEDRSPLWRSKLYAFEPLADVALGVEPTASDNDVRNAFDTWIDAWIDTVDVGGQNYLRRLWTPWSVSLRIQRWLRYLAWRRADPAWVDPDADAALRRETYKNACFLRNHVERDVGGNHLIENGAALLVAGLAFEAHDTDWIETGLSILDSAAERQFLDDGCHFERSPMYHALVLTRFLTAQDLLERTGRPVPPGIASVATVATGFLERLRPPDGRIPLLNDAVYGEALPLDACLRYADRVGVGRVESRDEVPRTVRDVPPTISGYEWLRTEIGSMLVDGGPVGPRHLPGHSHSDTLGVLLWIGDHPVVTDTGTFDYVAGPRREYARGVRGHNTVQVGTSEPIAIGGKYLMGPRLRPTASVRSGEVSLFEGRYEANPLGESPYAHHRAIYAGDDWWVIDDTVRGDGASRARGRLHLHPDVVPAIEDDGVSLRIPGERTIRIHALSGATIDLEDGWYYPRFGEAIERPVLRFESSDTDPATIGAALTTDAVESAEWTMDGGQRVRFDRTEHRLPTPKLRAAEFRTRR